MSSNKCQILLSGLLGVVYLLTIQTIARAGGDSGFRTAQKTSLYTCPGSIFEMFYEYGNTSRAAAGLNLVCIQVDRKARWIIRSAAEVDLSGSRQYKDFPLKASVVNFRDLQGNEKGKIIRNYYRLPKAVLGEFCDIVDSDIKDTQENSDREYHWRCQKYSYLGATELATTGTEAMLPLGSFHHPKFDPIYTFSDFDGPISGYYKTWRN